jgi:hypothetical protein
MSSIYKELVESFGYTAVMEAVSLDTILAAVGQEKDEQKRAATLNDIAWKENLPGLYDPVSGYFVRKQSMPARSGARYDIAATGSNSADKELADKGLIPDSAKTSTAIGRMVRGDDKGQYDQDIRTRNQAAAGGGKPPGQGGQDLPVKGSQDSIDRLNQAMRASNAGAPPNITAQGSEFGTDAAFAGKANDDLKDLDIGFGPGKMTPDDNKPLPEPREAGIAAANNQSSSVDDKRKRYAELLAKAKDSTVPSGSRM